jgi:hypothetical protein
MHIDEIKHHIIHDNMHYVDKIYIKKDVLKKAQNLKKENDEIIVIYDDNIITLDYNTFIKLKNRFKSDFVNYEDFIVAINEARRYFKNLYANNKKNSTLKSNPSLLKQTNKEEIETNINKIKKIYDQIDFSLIKYKTHTKLINKEIKNIEHNSPTLNEQLTLLINNDLSPVTEAFKNTQKPENINLIV